MNRAGVNLHPLSVIDDQAIIEDGVDIGPFCVVGPNVVLKSGVRLISHVSIVGRTTIGANTVIYPHASLGHPPQDLKFKGEPSTVVIGSNNTIREFVTIQPGTESGRMTTVVGDGCLLMAGVHIAHDCIVGNNVVMANYATLAGHVQVGDHVVIGGLSAFQQFVRIGSHAMIGGMSGVDKDVIPGGLVMGERAHLHGLNLVGLRRHGFSNQDIQSVQAIFKDIFDHHDDVPFHQRVENQRHKLNNHEAVFLNLFLDFLMEDTKRHICMPKKIRF